MRALGARRREREKRWDCGGNVAGEEARGVVHTDQGAAARRGDTAATMAVAILARLPEPAAALANTPRPAPIAPLGITAFTATTALGAGLAAQHRALQDRRGGLRRNDLPGLPLECWIGRVDGVEDRKSTRLNSSHVKIS